MSNERRVLVAIVAGGCLIVGAAFVLAGYDRLECERVGGAWAVVAIEPETTFSVVGGAPIISEPRARYGCRATGTGR